MKSTLGKTSWLVILVVIIVFVKGLLCNAELDEVSAEMKKFEKENLYNAIQGFVGQFWNGSDLYPDPCGWTPIQGVSCDFIDGFWYVTDLNIGPIHENSLTCSKNPQFKPQIFELKHLKSLSFYNCFSSHHLITLPTDKWANLSPSLESLEFRSNPSLIGTMPYTFGTLQMLQSLVLIENGLTGNIPSEIGTLKHLKKLVLSGNNFTGRFFDTIGNLNELLILDLSRNSLSGYIPISIGYLKSLLKLDLSNNLLMGSIPNELGNLKNLTLLDLRNNKITGGFTKSIEEITSMQELVLSNNPIEGEIVNVNWENLQNLVILDLSNVGLYGTIPNSLAQLKKLRYVGLSNNNLTGSVPNQLGYMPCVSAIYVNGNNLTGILNFSEGFYGKLGRRFKAWNNPNLCYVSGLMSSGYAPIGVQPCTMDESGVSGSDSEFQKGTGKVQEHLVWVSLVTESKKLSSDFSSSFGLLRHGSDGVWLVFLLEFSMMILLWNFFR